MTPGSPGTTNAGHFERLAAAPLAAGVMLALLILAAGTPLEAEELLYYVEGDSVVFTNTPVQGTKPVPGWRSTRLPQPDTLPVTPWDPFIERVAARTGLTPGLIKAVAWVESAFNPKAVSPKGAMGLMQLMPATAKALGVNDPFDPYDNLWGGSRHLRDLLDEWNHDLDLALAAYNAGSGAVRRYNGVPAYRETRRYVAKVRERLGSRPRHTRTASSSPPRTIRMRRAADGSISLSN